MKDTITVKRVFAEPYEIDDLTLIAVAAVAGGTGTGTDPAREQGEGGGFGVNAHGWAPGATPSESRVVAR